LGYEYDVAGRVKTAVALDEHGYEQPTSYEYDPAGWSIAVILSEENAPAFIRTFIILFVAVRDESFFVLVMTSNI
jgi:hypothetical protein